MNADRRLLDRLLLQAVINVYGRWPACRAVPAAERSLAAHRVNRARRELAALTETAPMPVISPHAPPGEGARA